VAGALSSASAGSTWNTVGVLIGMRRSLARSAPGGAGMARALRSVGLLAAVGTLLLGLVRFPEPDRSVDLLATIILAALLELGVVVLLSKVVVAGLAATLSARRGQELGGLLMAIIIIALASGGWSLVSLVGEQLAAGPGTALGAALRVLPSGWGPVAVAAAGRSDWSLAAAALAGLAVLSGLLLLAWGSLLERSTRKPAGHPPRTAPGRTAPTRLAAPWRGTAGGRRVRRARSSPRRSAWRRDPARSVLLLLALLVSRLSLAVPAAAFHAPAALAWVGLAAALVVGMGAGNVYGDEGTALWLTRMVPGVERADVHGRQIAWLLEVGPVIVGLTVVVTILSGQHGAWPWLLAAVPAVPAVLGGTAGLMVLVSAAMPIRQKDPHRRTGPFGASDDPNAAAALIGRQYLMLLLAALAAVPGGILVLLGSLSDRPFLLAAGVLVGAGTGLLLCWWGGRIAARRLTDRGAELMDLLHLGPPAPRPTAPAVRLSRPTSATRSALWLVGILCVVPQGLVPIGFNLLGVDQQVKVWFAARYLPADLQIPVAAGFILLGALAIWSAESIRRHHTTRP
jgi:ABC-2 type transport system permease protein